MADGDGSGSPGPTAAEAFAALGNEVRIAVLRVLLERESEAPLPFSELYDAVGVDDSGRFNYHLQRLTDHFVERTEAGYELRYPGRKVGHAVAAGTFTTRQELEPFPIEGACYACDDRSLRATYRDERLVIRCDACDQDIVAVPFPPAGVADRTPAEVLAAFDRWSFAHARLAAANVCPECAGPMAGRVEDDVPDRLDFEVLPRFECTSCHRSVVMSFGSFLLHHPEVESFYRQRGRYPRSGPYWTVEHCVTDNFTAIRSTDPWRIEVAFPADDATLRVTLDGDLDVVEVAGNAH